MYCVYPEESNTLAECVLQLIKMHKTLFLAYIVFIVLGLCYVFNQYCCQKLHCFKVKMHHNLYSHMKNCLLLVKLLQG